MHEVQQLKDVEPRIKTYSPPLFLGLYIIIIADTINFNDFYLVIILCCYSGKVDRT